MCTSLLAKAGSGVGFIFGVRAWTELEIRCVKGMYRLKLVSSAGLKGLLMHGYVWGTHSLIPSSITTVSYLVLKNNAIGIIWWTPSKFNGSL